MPDPKSSSESEGRSCESYSLLMGYMLNDLHIRLGLEQLNVAHMMMRDKPDRKLVECRPLNKENPKFRMDFGLDDTFNDVAGRVAAKVHVDRDRIKLTAHNCTSNQPDYVDLHQGYQFKSLREALVDPDERTICDVLYYYVVTPPKISKTDEVVAYEGYPNAKQEHANDETLAERRAFRRKKCLEMRNFPRWLNMLEILKRRGKGSPTKGQGRQANIRKITWGKVEDDALDNPKRLKGGYYRV